MKKEKKDHRKLRKELTLFTISDLVGTELSLIQPNGMIVRKAIEDTIFGSHIKIKDIVEFGPLTLLNKVCMRPLVMSKVW
jgi:hypothetical protein